MQHLEISGAVRPLYGWLGVKGLVLSMPACPSLTLEQHAAPKLGPLLTLNSDLRTKCCPENWPTIYHPHSLTLQKIWVFIHIIIIIIINIKDWTLWSVPSPELQLRTPTFLRSSNCSSSLWYDFKGFRFCGILCKCWNQFRVYSSILFSIPVICNGHVWRLWG